MMSVACLSLSLAVLCLASSASASPSVEESRHQKELREHYHHLSYIADYSCHHPQPRSVPVHELLSPYQTRGKAYFPEVTVLHRCDAFAGCCEGGKTCGPLHADTVHLPFKVTYLEDMAYHHKGEWEMEYFSFDNHTVCHCDHHPSYTPLVHNHYDQDHHSQSKDHHHEPQDHHDRDHGLDHGRGGLFKPVHEHEHERDHDHDEHVLHDQAHRPENKKIDSLYITI